MTENEQKADLIKSALTIVDKFAELDITEIDEIEELIKKTKKLKKDRLFVLK